jgi:hypothetical protein
VRRERETELRETIETQRERAREGESVRASDRVKVLQVFA